MSVKHRMRFDPSSAFLDHDVQGIRSGDAAARKKPLDSVGAGCPRKDLRILDKGPVLRLTPGAGETPAEIRVIRAAGDRDWSYRLALGVRTWHRPFPQLAAGRRDASSSSLPYVPGGVVRAMPGCGAGSRRRSRAGRARQIHLRCPPRGGERRGPVPHAATDRSGSRAVPRRTPLEEPGGLVQLVSHSVAIRRRRRAHFGGTHGPAWRT
jgi:hypothetical protein